MTELRNNLVWAAVFFLAAALSALVIILRTAAMPDPKTAQIIQDGAVIKTVGLENISEPYEFDIAAQNGGYNTVRAEKGKIGIISADCPDKICVKQGFISGASMSIVCLPHRLSIVISDDKHGAADAVAGGLK